MVDGRYGGDAERRSHYPPPWNMLRQNRARLERVSPVSRLTPRHTRKHKIPSVGLFLRAGGARAIPSSSRPHRARLV
jgi:hypothetical protein